MRLYRDQRRKSSRRSKQFALPHHNQLSLKVFGNQLFFGYIDCRIFFATPLPLGLSSATSI